MPAELMHKRDFQRTPLLVNGVLPAVSWWAVSVQTGQCCSRRREGRAVSSAFRKLKCKDTKLGLSVWGVAYAAGSCYSYFCFIDQVFVGSSVPFSITGLVPTAVVVVLLGSVSLVRERMCHCNAVALRPAADADKLLEATRSPGAWLLRTACAGWRKKRLLCVG